MPIHRMTAPPGQNRRESGGFVTGRRTGRIAAAASQMTEMSLEKNEEALAETGALVG